MADERLGKALTEGLPIGERLEAEAELSKLACLIVGAFRCDVGRLARVRATLSA